MGRAWVAFQYLGLGPPVNDEALRRAEPVRSTIVGLTASGEPTQVASEVETWIAPGQRGGDGQGTGGLGGAGYV